MTSRDQGLLLLDGRQISDLLCDREREIIEVVERAYRAHDRGHTVMPENTYLRFPGMDKERIIAKIAYLGDGFDVAGIKWISSFPNNVAKNLERASATVILNSTETGHPSAILEGSVISAKRTAASAALAAERLWHGDPVSSVGMVGCGLINFEILRFLLACFPHLETVNLLDLSRERAELLASKAERLETNLRVRFAGSFSELSRTSQIVSLATTEVTPHVDSLASEILVLHVSVRDLTPEVILEADNVVDDVDQVCSNNTSLHLTERRVGHREFIRCSLGEILNGSASAQGASGRSTIFTPFGLGALDVALAQRVATLAEGRGVGTRIPSFLPRPWLERP